LQFNFIQWLDGNKGAESAEIVLDAEYHQVNSILLKSSFNFREKIAVGSVQPAVKKNKKNGRGTVETGAGRMRMAFLRGSFRK
jgi:hypothetical protein